VNSFDNDEYWDDDVDLDESETSGRVMLLFKMGSTRLVAQLDTAAQSTWISHAWYSHHYGEPDPNSAGASGANSSALDVSGRGKVTFSICFAYFQTMRCACYVG
jgi:hypothetical protein